MREAEEKKAWELAQEQCKIKGYSLEKLKKAKVYDMIDCIGVSMPAETKTKPNGLVGDMLTLPRTLFVYLIKEDKLIEEPAAAELLM